MLPATKFSTNSLPMPSNISPMDTSRLAVAKTSRFKTSPIFCPRVCNAAEDIVLMTRCFEIRDPSTDPRTAPASTKSRPTGESLIRIDVIPSRVRTTVPSSNISVNSTFRDPSSVFLTVLLSNLFSDNVPISTVSPVNLRKAPRSIAMIRVKSPPIVSSENSIGRFTEPSCPFVAINLRRDCS